MKKQGNFFWSPFVEIYRQFFAALKSDPTIWMLFLFLAVLDWSALALLFMSHSEPVSVILAPLVRTFYSERFLHYPQNFFILPRLFNHAHFLITTIIGVFISGLVIIKIQNQVTAGRRMTVIAASKLVVKRYFSMIAVWIFSYALFMAAFRLVLPFFARNIGLYLGASFVMAMLIQTSISYFLPIIMIDGTGILKALVRGFRFSARRMLLTMMIILIPMVLAVGISYLKMLTPVYLRIYPELVMVVLAVSVVFMTVVDLAVTSVTTILYVKERNQKS